MLQILQVFHLTLQILFKHLVFERLFLAALACKLFDDVSPFDLLELILCVNGPVAPYQLRTIEPTDFFLDRILFAGQLRARVVHLPSIIECQV